MIRFERVSFSYPGAHTPTLNNINLEIPDGEFVLVIGPTGSGKSTLLRAINGLVPHFSGGTLSGRVSIDGRDTRDNPPRELADVVGYVGQDPLAGFVSDTVEDELAYAMESLGMPPSVMRQRVEEILDGLGLSALRDRPLVTLSSGEQQRVAIGSVLAAGPRVLVLDEPTSALDPPAAEEVLATLTRLVHDLGMTVIVAEHRLERVVQYADRVLQVLPDGAVVDSAPELAMVGAQVAPPVVELGRLLNWQPLPLSVRDARRAAGPLKERLARIHQPVVANQVRSQRIAQLDNVVIRYGETVALAGVDLEVGAGDIVALMGRNGAGKSTLLASLVGLVSPTRGKVTVGGREPHRLVAAEVARLAGLVPQQPADLFCEETVAAELASDGKAAAAQNLLELLAPGIDPQAHPRDLSEGQRLSVALALVLALQPPLILLDEPTRGLDYPAKSRLVNVLRTLAADGAAIIIATHDVELAAELASRTAVLADGEVVADGPTAHVVTASPAFAPQVARILHPLPWLTVAQVRAGLQASAS